MEGVPTKIREMLKKVERRQWVIARVRYIKILT